MRKSVVRYAVAVPWVVASVVSLFGCVTHEDSTQLTVVLSSEADIPAAINLLQVSVSSNGSTLGPYVTDLSRDSNGFFPQTVALIPQDESSISQPVTVTVSGLYAGSSSSDPAPVVLRSAVVSYVEGHTLLLPMPLRMACFQTTCDGVGQSCIGGTCSPTTIESTSLVDYDPKYVYASAGSACFDHVACLAAPVEVPVDPTDCTFDLPAGSVDSSGKVNVNAAVQWQAAPGRVIVLEGDDPNEGWTYSASNPTKGQVSPGVCKALMPGSGVASVALSLYLSTACEAKSHLLPSCDSACNTGVYLSGVNGKTAGTCNDND